MFSIDISDPLCYRYDVTEYEAEVFKMKVDRHKAKDLKRILSDLIILERMIYSFDGQDDFPETELTPVITELTKLIKNLEVS